MKLQEIEDKGQILTNLIKQVTASSQFQKHIKARWVPLGMCQLDNRRIHEFENIDMFQSLMNTHLLFYCLPVFVGCLGCESNEFACCCAVVGYVDSSEDTGREYR